MEVGAIPGKIVIKGYLGQKKKKKKTSSSGLVLEMHCIVSVIQINF